MGRRKRVGEKSRKRERGVGGVWQSGDGHAAMIKAFAS